MIFAIGVIGSIAGGIVTAIYLGKAAAYSCGSYSYYSGYSKNGAAGFFAGLGIFILISVIGFLASWVGSFFMYGLGQLIEDTEINRQTNQQILRQLQRTPQPQAKPAAPVTSASPAASAKPSVPYSAPVTNAKAPVVPIVLEDGRIRCPNCGAVQPGNRTVCWDCGTPFSTNKGAAVHAEPDPKGAPSKTAPSTSTMRNNAAAVAAIPMDNGQIRCPKCGTPQSAWRNACSECGIAFNKNDVKEEPKTPNASSALRDAWDCPKCGSHNPADAIFCSICGTRKS